MLGILGYEAVLVPDGERAVEAYRKARDAGKPFRGVVTELALPHGMGGVEVLHRLASLDPAVTAIASCERSDDPVMADHARYGFRGAVRKPYTVRELAKALRAILGD